MNNYWLALPVAVSVSVKNYISDPGTYVPGEDTSKMRGIAAIVHDFATVSTLFKSYQGKDLFNIYGTVDELVDLINDYPQAELLGGWDESGDIIEPIDANLINYMPDNFVVDNWETFEGHYEMATQLKNVNVLNGHRSFTDGS